MSEEQEEGEEHEERRKLEPEKAEEPQEAEQAQSAIVLIFWSVPHWSLNSPLTVSRGYLGKPGRC